MEPDHFAEREAAPAKERRGRQPAYTSQPTRKAATPSTGPADSSARGRPREPANNLGEPPAPGGLTEGAEIVEGPPVLYLGPRPLRIL